MLWLSSVILLWLLFLLLCGFWNAKKTEIETERALSLELSFGEFMGKDWEQEVYCLRKRQQQCALILQVHTDTRDEIARGQKLQSCLERRFPGLAVCWPTKEDKSVVVSHVMENGNRGI